MLLRKSAKWKAEGFRLLFGNLAVLPGDEMARSTLSADVEFHILHNYPWAKLPSNVKQVNTSNVLLY